MKTSSAKAKGRRLQNLVRDSLRFIGAKFGLEPYDIDGRGMGQNGVDVILSPAAKKLFPFDIECKNHEKLNVAGIFWKHFNYYQAKDTLKMLIHSKNRSEPLVTVRLEDFLDIWQHRLHNASFAQGMETESGKK